MEFIDTVKKRYSVRSYKSKEVEEEKLNTVLESAQWAPTAVNKQPFQLIVIKTRGREKELNLIYPVKWFVEAPLIICACTLKEEGWTRRDGKNYSEVDTAIAMDHLILAATSLGLGTCWVAAFNLEAAREVLGIPENVLPLIFTPLGYPNDEVGLKTRKDLKDLVRYDKW
ncbi:MAG TPA: nitroreductase family protein [Methanobacterium sp.]|nr:nitroreductase family protein [Methanobacterium sp.]